MNSFLQRFYDYVNSSGGFNCVEFEYCGITYQVSEGHLIVFTDNSNQRHEIILPKDIECLLDAKALADGKSLREVWSNASDQELNPEFF